MTVEYDDAMLRRTVSLGAVCLPSRAFPGMMLGSCFAGELGQQTGFAGLVGVVRAQSWSGVIEHFCRTGCLMRQRAECERFWSMFSIRGSFPARGLLCQV